MDFYSTSSTCIWCWGSIYLKLLLFTKELRGPGLVLTGPLAPAYSAGPAPGRALPRYIFSGPAPCRAFALAELSRPRPWQGHRPGWTFALRPWQGLRPGKILRPRPWRGKDLGRPGYTKLCVETSVIQFLFNQANEKRKRSYVVVFCIDGKFVSHLFCFKISRVSLKFSRAHF